MSKETAKNDCDRATQENTVSKRVMDVVCVIDSKDRVSDYENTVSRQ